ncbi:hypothetical protein [Aquimarina litoralis]|uniref:hypothetical protein n=1 Tax=Aquimarina litoralis TaxID=584605 RepID=UPI001C5A36EE|nr:hypothetical protein [Aquimarina litoralis]MBW1296300.1 hypothetical protein [Aquimarina litoralis]
MNLGYFDYTFIVILIILNIVFWKKRTSWKLGCLIGIIFYILIPLISIGIEVNRYTVDKDLVDNFELLYTYFRFPFYWAIGLVQAIILGIKTKK